MPGLAKVRREPIAAQRSVDLVGLRKGWFAAMVASADVVSEGAVQWVDGVEGYFGSTSLRCVVNTSGTLPREVQALAELVIRDPNARLRLLRLAHREAVSRAGARSLDVLTAEITAAVSPTQGPTATLEIDIDVSAGLLDAVHLEVDKR
jgi:hypothetical protein